MQDIAQFIDMSAALLQSDTINTDSSGEAPSAQASVTVTKPTMISAETTQFLQVAVPLALGAAAVLVVFRKRLWRTNEIASGRLPRDPVLGALCMLGFIVVGALGVTIASGLAPKSADATHYARLILGVGKNLAEVAFAVALLASPLFWTAPRQKASIATAIREGFVGFLLAMPIVTALAMVLNAIALVLGQPTPPQVTHETLALLLEKQDALFTALTLAHVVILVPLAEEAGFRGILQGAMRRAGLGGLASALATSALFTLVHWSVLAPEGRIAGLAMLFVLGTILGVLRDRTGGILAPVLLHALFNAANVGIAFL